ncbi:MAG: hypothetical protein UU89_C0009G0024, partial [Parcubacteria group bacterium GW2011_GWC2_42_11]
IGFTVTFALYLLHNNVPQSIACWTMWALLDIFLLVTCFVAGNKRPWLPLGCALGASLVACILLSKSGWEWKWNTVETISAIGVLVALISRWKLGPKPAIVAPCVMRGVKTVKPDGGTGEEFHLVAYCPLTEQVHGQLKIDSFQSLVLFSVLV